MCFRYHVTSAEWRAITKGSTRGPRNRSITPPTLILILRGHPPYHLPMIQCFTKASVSHLYKICFIQNSPGVVTNMQMRAPRWRCGAHPSTLYTPFIREQVALCEQLQSLRRPILTLANISGLFHMGTLQKRAISVVCNVYTDRFIVTYFQI